MAEVHQDFELNNLSSTRAPPISNDGDTTWSGEQDTEIEQPPLPRTDSGKAAWLVLAGSSLIQAPVWGG